METPGCRVSKCRLNRSHPKCLHSAPFISRAGVQLEPELVMGTELKRLLVPFQGISNLVKSFGFGRLEWPSCPVRVTAPLFLSSGATNQHLTLSWDCGGEFNQSSFLKAFRVYKKKKKDVLGRDQKTILLPACFPFFLKYTQIELDSTERRSVKAKTFNKAIKHDFLSLQLEAAVVGHT